MEEAVPMKADEILSAAEAAATMVKMRGVALPEPDLAAFKLGFVEGVDWMYRHHLEKR